jgi:pilus assembly protein Flp/PilA
MEPFLGGRRNMAGLWKLLRPKKGQSLVEYALILALVAIVVIVALTALGSHTSNVMSNVSNTLGNAT